MTQSVDLHQIQGYTAYCPQCEKKVSPVEIESNFSREEGYNPGLFTHVSCGVDLWISPEVMERAIEDILMEALK